MLGFIGKFFGRGRPVVSVLRLSGPIGVGGRFRAGLSFESSVGQIEAAFAPSGLKAVALLVNSPGGSPVQSALILRRIRDLAREKDVPVLAFTEDVAASGGYMLALAGDEIYAHDASIIGSIGVVAGGFGFADAIKRLGIERRLYTAGENKARLDPFSEERPEDVAWLKSLQHEVHDYFRSIVLERRGKRLKADTEGLFSGDVWLGAKAVAIGLVDGIGEPRAILRQRFGKKVKLKSIARKKAMLPSLLSSRSRDGFADDLLAAIETRLLWNRFGL